MPHQQGVSINGAVSVVQDGHDEGLPDIAVDHPPNNIGCLVAAEQAVQHLDLEIWLGLPARPAAPQQSAFNITHILAQIAPVVAQAEAGDNLQDTTSQAITDRVITAVGRFAALKVFGTDHGTPEDVFAVIVISM